MTNLLVERIRDDSDDEEEERSLEGRKVLSEVLEYDSGQFKVFLWSTNKRLPQMI